MSTTPVTLKESVLNAFAESEKAAGSTSVSEETTSPKEDTTTKEDKSSEGTSETKEEATKSTVEEDDGVVEIDASPEEIRATLDLRRSLVDAKTAKATLEDIAKAGGYDLTKREDVKQLQRDAKTVLREKLGDSYDLLGGDKLAEAFDVLLDARVKEHTAPVLDRLALAEAQVNKEKADTAMEAWWKRAGITDAKEREVIAGKMLEKMKRMPASEGTDINNYLDDIHTLVNKERDKAREVKKVVTKIRTNAQEVSRTSGEGGPDDDSRVSGGSKLPSIREAVAAAFRGEKL